MIAFFHIRSFGVIRRDALLSYGGSEIVTDPSEFDSIIAVVLVNGDGFHMRRVLDDRIFEAIE